jgi:hypothetical protein
VLALVTSAASRAELRHLTSLKSDVDAQPCQVVYLSAVSFFAVKRLIHRDHVFLERTCEVDTKLSVTLGLKPP